LLAAVRAVPATTVPQPAEALLAMRTLLMIVAPRRMARLSLTSSAAATWALHQLLSVPLAAAARG
jgi:hypothetical protein